MISQTRLVVGLSILIPALVVFPEHLQAGTVYDCKDQSGSSVLSNILLGNEYNCKPLELFRNMMNGERSPREEEKDERRKAVQEKRKSATSASVKGGWTEAPSIDLKNIAFKISSPATYAPLKEVEKERPLIHVKNIAFKIAGDGKEILFIEFDRFYKPVVSGTEGKEPRIVLKIKHASSLREDWAAIDTGGNFIRRISASMDSQTGTALIALDMTPQKDYFVSQAFYERENLYALEISEDKKTQ